MYVIYKRSQKISIVSGPLKGLVPLHFPTDRFSAIATCIDGAFHGEAD